VGFHCYVPDNPGKFYILYLKKPVGTCGNRYDFDYPGQNPVKSDEFVKLTTIEAYKKESWIIEYFGFDNQ
jgi:hypothetical protein